MSGLVVRDLWKSFGGQRVLRGVSFTAAPGSVTCLMGPSGAGKTTLLRILLGLERPDGGEVRQTLRWAAVFQEDRLLTRRDAAGNLRFVLGRSYEEKTALALLEDLGLDDAAGKRVRDFSGGMRRRLALARALLAPADALALDEPFAGLDGANKARCLTALQKHGAGRLTVLVTHESADAVSLGAEIVTLPPGEGGTL